MAIAARTTNGSASADLAGQTGNITVSFGSAVASTDAVVLFIGYNFGGAGLPDTFTAPAGWTVILARKEQDSGSTSATIQGWVAYGNVASKLFTRSGGTASLDLGWVTQAFTGVDQTTILDSTGATASNTGANSITDATWNTVNNNALPFCGAVNWNGAKLFSATGFTAVMNGATHCQVGLLYSNTAITPAGATGNVTINDSASATGNILAIMPGALKVAAAAALSPPPYHRSQRFFRQAGLLLPLAGEIIRGTCFDPILRKAG